MKILTTPLLLLLLACDPNALSQQITSEQSQVSASFSTPSDWNQTIQKFEAVLSFAIKKANLGHYPGFAGCARKNRGLLTLVTEKLPLIAKQKEILINEIDKIEGRQCPDPDFLLIKEAWKLIKANPNFDNSSQTFICVRKLVEAHYPKANLEDFPDC